MRESVVLTIKKVQGNFNRVISHDGEDFKILRKEIHKGLRTQMEVSRKRILDNNLYTQSALDTKFNELLLPLDGLPGYPDTHPRLEEC